MVQKFETLKSDEKDWAIDRAADTLKEFARIKKDPKLLKAARKRLKEQIAEAQKAVKI